MAFIINQGQHVVDEILVAPRATAVIKQVKAHGSKEDFILLDLEIMDPAQYRGKHVPFDCPYVATHPVAFLYHNLRKAAGVPYQEGEPAQIDIGTMLENKAILVKLSERTHEGNTYQDVKIIGSPNVVAGVPGQMPQAPVPGGFTTPNPAAYGAPNNIAQPIPYQAPVQQRQAPQVPQTPAYQAPQGMRANAMHPGIGDPGGIPQQPAPVAPPTQNNPAPQAPVYQGATEAPQNQAPAGFTPSDDDLPF